MTQIGNVLAVNSGHEGVIAAILAAACPNIVKDASHGFLSVLGSPALEYRCFNSTLTNVCLVWRQ